jgi:ATP-binding cassette subfamily B protein
MVVKLNTNNILRIFIDLIKKYPDKCISLFILIIFEGACTALSILTLMPVIDYLIDPSLTNAGRITKIETGVLEKFLIPINIISIGSIFIISNLIQGLLIVSMRYFILKIKYAVIRDIFGDTISAFFSARWNFFSDINRGQLFNSLNKEMMIIGDTFGHLVSMFAQVFQLLIYFSVPIFINWKLTTLSILFVFIFSLPLLLLNRLSYRLGKVNLESSNKISSAVNEIIGLAKIIIGFGLQNTATERYFKAFDKHVKATLNSQLLSTAVPKIFQPLSIVAILLSIGITVKTGESFSEVAAVMWSLMAAMPIVGILVNGRITISNFLPSYEQLNRLKFQAEQAKEFNSDKKFNVLVSEISLNNVFFRHDSSAPVLNGINMRIESGKLTAIVGGSGSGKSTITDLIMGMQIPDKGTINIDGVNLSEYSLKSYREKIGYVPQDPILFDASIRENLIWANPMATQDDLISALELSNALKFVNNLPNGIDTVVGDRGLRLSGGQRQRIALARSLVRKPLILILDEATSSLDSESESYVQDAISRIQQNITILVIAHRMSTITKAEMVYVLRDGVIIESGSFLELSKNLSGELYGML